MNENDLKMYPVKQDDDVYQIQRELPTPLQKPPFVSIIVGGKKMYLMILLFILELLVLIAPVDI